MFGFVEEYFIDPMIYRSGYNIVNTLTYAFLFIGFLYLLLLLFRKTRVRITRGFFFALVPFVLSGSVVRVLEDAGVYERSFFTISPGVYLFVAFFGLFCLVVSRLLAGFFDWEKTFALFGCVFLLSHVSQLWMVRLDAFLGVLFLATLLCFAVVRADVLYAWTKKDYLSWLKKLPFKALEDRLILWGHLLDGCASFVAIGFFGYWEQHVLGRFLMDLLGPWGLIPAKIVVVSLVLYYLNKEEMDESEFWLLKAAVLALGLGPGMRDALLILLGV